MERKIYYHVRRILKNGYRISYNKTCKVLHDKMILSINIQNYFYKHVLVMKNTDHDFSTYGKYQYGLLGPLHT